MSGTYKFHADQLRACAAMGGYVAVLQVGADEPHTRLAADMLFSPPIPGPGPTSARKALTRAMAAAAAGEPNQARVTHLVQDAINASANSIARHFAAIEAAGGEIRYRGAE